MNQLNPTRILLVDDDSLILYGLEKIIEQYQDMQVIGRANNGYEALMFLQDTQPDIILLDIEMPLMNGIECLYQIRKQYPTIRVVLLTSYVEDYYIIEGLANGAQSYLLKTTPYADLGQYIRDAVKGAFVMPDSIAAKLAILLQQKNDTNEKNINPVFFQTYEMTNTEQQIIKLLAKRLSNQEIAEQLKVTVGTIKNHFVTIFKKLDVKNRQEAISLIETYFR